MERAAKAVMDLSVALDNYKAAQEDIAAINDYYGSEEWKQDYADDEAGLLPADLKRGVLSEDGIWNLLSDASELNKRIGNISDDKKCGTQVCGPQICVPLHFGEKFLLPATEGADHVGNGGVVTLFGNEAATGAVERTRLVVVIVVTDGLVGVAVRLVRAIAASTTVITISH